MDFKRLTIAIAAAFFISPLAYAAGVFLPVQGGTGISSVDISNVGNCLSVTNNNPLTYGWTGCAGGSGGTGVATTSLLASWPITATKTTASITFGYNGLATTSPWTNLQLAQVASNGTVSSIATSALKLTTSSFASPNVSQWTNNAGYLTSLSGAASSTLLGDNNTFSGTNTFSTLPVLGTLSGIIKGTSGSLSSASNGTDYTLLTATTCSVGQHVSAVTAAGAVTCSVDSGGGTWPFTPAIHWGQSVQGTTTALWLQGTPFSLFASSTSAFDEASTTGLTLTNQWFTGLTIGVLSVDSAGKTYRYATTSSSAAYGDVWRDANQNAFAQNFVSAGTAFPTNGGTVTLTAASPRNWILTGTNTQTVKLPSGTTLTVGTQYLFNNNSTGLVTIQDNGSNVLGYVLSGGSRIFTISDVSTTNGSWDAHSYLGHQVYSGYNSVAIGTSSPFAELSVHANPTDSVKYTTLFAISSSTAAATTTLFSVNNIGTTTLGRFGACNTTNALTTDSSGNITCGAITGGGGASYPFQLTGNATSTLTQFNAGLTAFASSTIGGGTTASGLTISGGATTTGNALIQGTLTTNVTGSTQCLHANSSGVVSGTGSDCGAGGGSTTIVQPQGRLTLSANTAVMTADITGTTTIRYTAYNGNQFPWYNGSSWAMQSFTSDLNLTLDTTNATSTNLYDVFAYNNSGTNVICYGASWTSTTTRSTALTQLNGLWVNSAQIICRNTSATTYTVPTDEGTYLGTFYATANGQTGVSCKPAGAAGGANNVIGLWNAYNRVPFSCIDIQSTANYVNATETWVAAGPSGTPYTGFRISFIDGLGQSPTECDYNSTVETSAATRYPWVGCDRNSTTNTPVVIGSEFSAGGMGGALFAHEPFAPSTGFSYYQAMQSGTNVNASTVNWNGSGTEYLLIKLTM